MRIGLAVVSGLFIATAPAVAFAEGDCTGSQWFCDDEAPSGAESDSEAAPSDGGEAVGFATVYWSWDTLIAARVGIMHDLFVIPPARGTGIADLLIEACVEECRRHGATKLGWQTAPDNTRARRVYERVGATKDEWIDYWLSVSPAAS